VNFSGKKITYGKRGWVRVEAVRTEGPRGTRFTLRAGRARCPVRLNYVGAHNVSNALGAAALSLGAGVTLAAVRRGLEKAKPFAMRMQIENWRGAHIINDAYNANPASMKAALQTLARAKGGRSIAVLGDMFELGRHSAKEHRLLGRAAAHAALDRVYLLGSQAAAVRRGALERGLRSEQVVIGRDPMDLGAKLRAFVKPGDWLLFKGSRGMKMERVLQALKHGKA
jgi:UDP-N-acetylmuramoyl-tripeptide--D-alanyl-D-alanine ligase